MHKLAMVVPSFQRRGAERVVSRLSLWLWKSGYDVSVITWCGKPSAYQFGGQIYDLNLPVVPWPFKPFRRWQRIFALRNLLLALQPRQVIGFLEAANIPVLAASLRMPQVCRPHVTVSIHDAPASFKPWVRYEMCKWYPKADRIVVLTNAGLQEHINKWGFSVEKCVVIPNPIDEAMLYPPPLQPAGSRAALVVAIGSLTKQKGFDLLLHAWSLACACLPAQLLIYGQGPEQSRLEKLIRKLKIESQVCLAGTTDDIKGALDQARVFVLSSRHEGFPNVLAEAMSRACACVAFDCPTGPAEMIENSTNGFLVPAGDIIRLGQALKQVLTDADLATSLGQEARKKAMEWSIDRIAPRWLL